MSLSPFYLVIFAPLVAFLTFGRHPHYLLLLALLNVALPPGDWMIAGARLNPDDLILGGIVTALVLRLGRTDKFRNVPYRRLWLLLGILLSVAYISAPMNAAFLTDPLRIGYQVSRYCWKPIAFYPLASMLIAGDVRRRSQMMGAIVLAGCLLSLHAAIQGYSLQDPHAFFSGGNSLGGALLVPLVLAGGGALQARGSRRFIIYAFAVGLIVRGLIFAASRGAFVATAGGGFVFLALLTTWAGGRKLVAKVAGAGLAGLILLFVVDPGFLQRPNVAHILTALQGTSDANFQWRMQERWPVFWEKIEQHPWFGIGTNRDTTLSTDANTPHNGYLSLAVTYGLPVAGLYVLFGLLALRDGWRAARRARSPEDRIFALACAAGVAGILIHNIVESTILITFVYNVFFVLAGMVTSAAKQRGTARAAAVVPMRRARPIRRRPLRPVLDQGR